MTISDMVPAPPPVAESKVRTNAQSRRTFAPWLVGLLIATAILATVAFEYGTYQHYFKRYIAPYYPVNDDQLETYQWAYNHSVASSTGMPQQEHAQAIALPNRPEAGMNMKGCIVPLLSLGATQLLGPHRFSIGLINLAYLIVGQIVLFFAMRRRSGIRPALLASGLFLMSTSHYYSAGGINDMRLDYAGLIMMGITYLAVLQSLESGKRKDLIVSGSCLLLCATTRSILLIYWLGTMLSAFVIFGGAELFHKTAALKQFRQRCGLILTCIAAVGAVYIALNWRGFASYYINCKTGGEDAMRRRENHIENIVQLLMYYPNSFWQHFQIMLAFAFGATLATLFGFLAQYLKPLAIKLSPNSSSNESRLAVSENDSLTASDSTKAASVRGVIDTLVTPPVVLLFGVVAAVLVCVTSYVPSPLVIGVLTMPLCISLALVIERLMQLTKVKLLPLAIASSIAICGLCHFNNQFKYPVCIPHQDLTEAKMVNHIFDVLIPRVNKYHRPIEILWSLVHGGLNEKALEIYSWEHFDQPLKVPIDARYVACYPQFSWPAYARQLKGADIVVAPVELAAPREGQFEYDGMKSMRENLPKMLDALKADGFVQLGTYQLHQPALPPVIGVFQKETR